MVRPIPRFAIDETPTGRSRGRIGKWGRIVMQLEFSQEVYDVTYPRWDYTPRKPVRTGIVWRDATKEDILRQVVFAG